ncbi:hypothetical protein LBMAG49_02150 [Planctomycetota bacterium]|nr:hypothetical protein LBMAG49_02150 [Planctomycetota bacterium]
MLQHKPAVAQVHAMLRKLLQDAQLKFLRVWRHIHSASCALKRRDCTKTPPAFQHPQQGMSNPSRLLPVPICRTDIASTGVGSHTSARKVSERDRLTKFRHYRHRCGRTEP